MPDDHLAFFVLDVVGELDCPVSGRVTARMVGVGLSYDPEMILAVLVYGYCAGRAVEPQDREAAGGRSRVSGGGGESAA